MNQTFARRLAWSFGLLCVLTAVTAALGVYALSQVIAAKDRMQEVNVHASTLAERLQTDTYKQSAAIRGSILSALPVFSSSLQESQEDSRRIQSQLFGLVDDAEGHARIADVQAASVAFDQRLAVITQMQEHGVTKDALTQYMLSTAMPQRLQLEKEVGDFAAYEARKTEVARQAAVDVASRYRLLMIAVALLVMLLAVVLAYLLSRLLGGRIGTAVQEIQTSAAQLQSTATQQATGAREQATAMSEITTTMTELLTTSRQIADSSQRVAAFSRDTAEAARVSDQTVERAQSSLNAIRTQVDVVVTHMLDLGRKSQQIGSVVEVISELAEQTNILAINANIEAAGAGEAGRRFGVVADEIRKLADRVAGSARQTRGMVDDVRAAINTTVMATESGSKAVDTGARDFAEVTSSLDQIMTHVSTAEEAAREIELSTKQQSTAVEQVNLAVGNVAQVARDVEMSTTEASKTATQLARLSACLTELINHQGAGNVGSGPDRIE